MHHFNHHSPFACDTIAFLILAQVAPRLIARAQLVGHGGAVLVPRAAISERNIARLRELPIALVVRHHRHAVGVGLERRPVLSNTTRGDLKQLHSLLRS